MKQTDRTSHSASHPLQSEAWGAFRGAMGVNVVRTHDWQMTFHPIPHTPYTIGYFPKGPKPTTEMLEELVQVGKEKNAIFIQLEPSVHHDSGFMIHDSRVKPSHHPLFTKYTFVLDLTKSEDELLAAMHPKTRYNIRVAQKHGVVVREDSSDEAFEEYLRLEKETTDRQGFYAHNETYHRRMWDIMHKGGIAHLFTATYGGRVITAWICFVYGDTLYYPYGASSRDFRNVMAPTLQLWEIVKWAKKKGLKKFDLWGAMGPNPNEKDPFYGFHRFKQGFNPELVEFVGSYDLVINPVLYELYKVADKLRWFLLRLKK